MLLFLTILGATFAFVFFLEKKIPWQHFATLLLVVGQLLDVISKQYLGFNANHPPPAPPLMSALGWVLVLQKLKQLIFDPSFGFYHWQYRDLPVLYDSVWLCGTD